MDSYHSVVYNSQMQNVLFITLVFVVVFLFKDVIISKSGFLTITLGFWYQKVHFSDIQYRARCFVRHPVRQFV